MDSKLLVSILDNLEPHLSLLLLNRGIVNQTVDEKTAVTLRVLFHY